MYLSFRPTKSFRSIIMSFQALLNGSAQCGPSNPLKTLLKHFQPDLISSQKDHFIPTQAQKFSHSNQPERSQAWNNHFLSSSLLPLVTPKDLAHMEHSFRIISHPSSASDSLASAESFHWTQEFKNPLCSVQTSIGTNTPASHSVPSPPIRPLHTSTIGHFPRPSIFTQNFPMSSRSSSILHPSESNSSGQIVEFSAEHCKAEFEKMGNHFLDQNPWQGSMFSNQPL
ncbi:hypothetical protein O181_084785 [Austropuccinia psidii MF-1]|uniref:Uncharacterized protein n=1 Tax=Austropuccinia psidii MF-1 TaxID=1389203 RepID=A0A9Q3FQV9_9BASI|nr:hypothetical protein [Austropuccinia psidii MF-1]